MTNSDYLDRPIRSLGDALRERGAADRKRGVLLEDCPFRTPKMREGWRLGWHSPLLVHSTDTAA